MDFEIDHIQEILHNHGYEYKYTIGKGGFSSVFLCYSHKYDLDFAVKRAVKNQLTLDEYNTLVSLIHPNIIRLYDAFEEESAQYLVMEYCPVGPINQKGKLTYDQFINYSKQILEAITYCHSLNIAHRDIKPENIFVDQNDNVRLADFGIAKHFDDFDKSEEKCGSLKYFSPEMLQCKDFDPFKADIWAIGVTFFCMATGEYPFKNVYTREDLKKSIMYSGFNYDRYEIDERIRFLIVKMTQHNPDMRQNPDRLLKLPMFNPIGREKIIRARRLSSTVGQIRSQRRFSYTNGSLQGRERAKSMNLSLAHFGSSDEDVQKSASPLLATNSFKSTNFHSPLQHVHCTFQQSKLIDIE